MLNAEDRLEIIDLYGRYSAHFDSGDGEGWASLFSPDGAFEIAGADRIYRGQRALADFTRRRVQKTPGIRHLVSNIVITGSGAAARGEASVIVLRVDDVPPASVRLVNFGGYSDDLVRMDDEWRFLHRRFVSWLDACLIDSTLAAATR